MPSTDPPPRRARRVHQPQEHGGDHRRSDAPPSACVVAAVRPRHEHDAGERRHEPRELHRRGRSPGQAVDDRDAGAGGEHGRDDRDGAVRERQVEDHDADRAIRPATAAGSIASAPGQRRLVTRPPTESSARPAACEITTTARPAGSASGAAEIVGEPPHQRRESASTTPSIGACSQAARPARHPSAVRGQAPFEQHTFGLASDARDQLWSATRDSTASRNAV